MLARSALAAAARSARAFSTSLGASPAASALSAASGVAHPAILSLLRPSAVVVGASSLLNVSIGGAETVEQLSYRSGYTMTDPLVKSSLVFQTAVSVPLPRYLPEVTPVGSGVLDCPSESVNGAF